MKVLRYIILSPIGIAFVLVHWLIAAYAILSHFPSNDNPYYTYTMLQVYLAWFDMPALWVTNLLATSLISLFSLAAWTNYIYTIFAIIFCSLQWLLVGALLQFLIAQHAPDSSVQPIKPRSS